MTDEIAVVDISNKAFFRDLRKLQILNYLFSIHSTVSPGLLMGGTGCNYEDALFVLMFLFELYLVDGFILVYDKRRPNDSIQRRTFKSGFPKTPFYYVTDGKRYKIQNRWQLFFRFEFDCRQKIQFEVIDLC